MKAIEVELKTDDKGTLKFDYNLNIKSADVKVLILYDELEDDDKWMRYIVENPEFDFLKDSEEDIYTVNDGEPFVDIEKNIHT